MSNDVIEYPDFEPYNGDEYDEDEDDDYYDGDDFYRGDLY
jgi:hypothetical protein